MRAMGWPGIERKPAYDIMNNLYMTSKAYEDNDKSHIFQCPEFPCTYLIL
jgi:hypothetical protein